MPATTTLEQAPALPLPLVRREGGPARPRGLRRSRRRWTVPALAVLAVAGCVAWFLLNRAPRDPVPLRMPEGPVAARPMPGTIVGLGRVLPRSRIVTIAPPFGAGDARIAALPVAEGDRVEAGATLAVLDSEPSLRAALAVAGANLASREAALRQTRINVEATREEARANLARAEAAIAANRRDLDRALSLLDRGASTQQVVDQRRVAYDQSVQDVARARAALIRTDVPDLDQQADVVVARREAEALRAQVESTRADLAKARILAPFAGTVLTIQARVGERPGQTTGLMSFATLDDMIAEVEVYENFLRDLRPGLPVTLTAAALGEHLHGTVSRIGMEILRQSIVDASPAANTDSRVARVTVELDDRSKALAARLPNLQVTARFATGGAP
ncbi:HlyD family secretion protein [Roseomonas sp. CCTCC AB2023176]|uniref:HlyD family secretion protein n=1 Tax=Roseomonas sp. CCTCC AB2023176 TaxID=3342640 RepID=UPI0035DEBF85